MDSNLVEDWAKDEFNLIEEHEGECHDAHLETCSDGLLITEASSRGLMNKFKQNIVNCDYEKRFGKIVDKGNSLIIEKWLSEMETKLQITV